MAVVVVAMATTPPPADAIESKNCRREEEGLLLLPLPLSATLLFGIMFLADVSVGIQDLATWLRTLPLWDTCDCGNKELAGTVEEAKNKATMGRTSNIWDCLMVVKYIEGWQTTWLNVLLQSLLLLALPLL